MQVSRVTPSPTPYPPSPKSAAFIYSDKLLSYGFDEKHPLKPQRMRMTYELLRDYGVFDLPNAKHVEPIPATREDILLAHDEDYVDRVEKISRGEVVYDAFLFGFRYPDNPPFPGIYEASLLYTGASVQAAEMVMSGEVDIAFNIAGGLHHAQRRRASGFCTFNDAVVALHHMLKKWSRVAYIDIDAHHGDGVQNAFYETNRVLTCSIHESGRTIFPGTGFVEEIGTGEGEGFTVNAPLAVATDDAAFNRVLDEGIIQVVKAYSPDAVLIQLGVDGHFEDPMTHLNYTSHGWMQAVKTLLALNLPTVAVGGGGYNLYTVCRLWSLAFAEMAGAELPRETPDSFFERHRIRVLRDIFVPELSNSEERVVRLAATETLVKIRELVFPKFHSP